MGRYGISVSECHIGEGSPSFVSNMRRLLQVKCETHYTMGHKSGKLAASRLWRVGMPPIDGGDWNSQVFKRKTDESDVLNTAVMLLSDASGSMSGEKYTTAARGCGLINHAFSQVLHIPVSVVTFTSCGETPVMGIIKDFDEKVTSDVMAERFYDFSSKMSGNNDADSLMWAYHKIMRRREKRKVIIVLSDGSPADGLGDPYHALKTVTEHITREKLVDLYGLGIMDTNVKDFYPKHKVIRSINELEPAMVELMGKALT